MAEKYFGQLDAKLTAPATGDLLAIEDSEDTKKIDYNALANAILDKLTTKTYTVAGGSNTLIAAINTLNSNTHLSLSETTYKSVLANMPTSRTIPVWMSGGAVNVFFGVSAQGFGVAMKGTATSAYVAIITGGNTLRVANYNPTAETIGNKYKITIPADT